MRMLMWFPDNGTESSDEEGEIGRRCKTGKTSQNV